MFILSALNEVTEVVWVGTQAICWVVKAVKREWAIAIEWVCCICATHLKNHCINWLTDTSIYYMYKTITEFHVFTTIYNFYILFRFFFSIYCSTHHRKGSIQLKTRERILNTRESYVVWLLLLIFSMCIEKQFFLFFF